MSSIFYGLNIASNALKTQTAVLNITAHNIANAETPGYSKQNVIVTSIADDSSRGIRSSPTISLGGGSQPMEVARSRFALYDAIWRKENEDLNDFVKTQELMNQIEVLFDEPSDRGMSKVINDFFNGWQEVGNDPQNMAARQSLRSFGEELTTRLHRMNTQLQILRQDLDTEIQTIPNQINEVTGEIADLNVAIRASEGQGASANDLRDKRDHLVDELSSDVDVRIVEQKDGTYTVLIGNQVVVERDDHSLLHITAQVAEGESYNRTVIRSDEGIQYNPERGKLGALMRFRDEHIPFIIDKLDTFTESLVNAVNYEHSFGYGLDGSTGLNFFDPQGTKAFNIQISNDIDEVQKIAASGDGSYGDNSNALLVHALLDQDVVEGKFTITEFYNSLVSTIGIMARDANTGRMNEELLVSQVDNAREGIKGVSIDDELISMISAQRIYQSAARLVSVLDSLFEEIIRLK